MRYSKPGTQIDSAPLNAKFWHGELISNLVSLYVPYSLTAAFLTRQDAAWYKIPQFEDYHRMELRSVTPWKMILRCFLDGGGSISSCIRAMGWKFSGTRRF